MMIYTEDVRKKLDAILKAFECYIDGQNYFDIVYSKKIGYVWIVVDEPGAAGAEPHPNLLQRVQAASP